MAGNAQLARQREAFRLTNDLLNDLISGTSIYTTLRLLLGQQSPPVSEEVITGVKRMSLFHVILTLSKWAEFYDRYKAFIPNTVKDIAKDLGKYIKDRGIVSFRNTVVGHVWDSEQKRALTNDEVEQRIQALMPAGGFAAFMVWAGSESVTPNKPIFVIESVRDAIRDTYNLTDDDLHR